MVVLRYLASTKSWRSRYGQRAIDSIALPALRIREHLPNRSCPVERLDPVGTDKMDFQGSKQTATCPNGGGHQRPVATVRKHNAAVRVAIYAACSSTGRCCRSCCCIARTTSSPGPSWSPIAHLEMCFFFKAFESINSVFRLPVFPPFTCVRDPISAAAPCPLATEFCGELQRIRRQRILSSSS